jgi:TPR repeat protein
MSKKSDFALVPRPPSALEKAEPGAKRILSGMVADTLALIPVRLNAEAKDWFEKGSSYFKTNNYTEAVRWYRKAAEQNYPLAQYDLGICYERGWGVAQDEVEALKWYRKAAEQNYALAQYALGYCHWRGQGVPQDRVEAVRWYRKAGEQGYDSGQHGLGVCYLNGCGVPQDYAEAVTWFRKAAEQGHARAQFNLGFCYEHGQGVPQDFGEAVKWYRKAADRGHTSAQENLGACYANGRAAIDIEDAVEVYKWVKLAEEHGYEGATKTAAVIEVLLSPVEFREAERRYDELKLSRQSINTHE